MPEIEALEFKKVIPTSLITKVDEAKREVWGLITEEVEDCEGETCDVEGSWPYFEEFSKHMLETSDNQNCMPLREMHQLWAAGKGISLDYRKDKQQIYGGFKVVDDSAWEKVQQKVYTGFSQGGRYIKSYKKDGKKYYISSPIETSLVDVPCLPTATFEYVKADGTTELRKFRDTTKEVSMETNPAKEEIQSLKSEVENLKAKNSSLDNTIKKLNSRLEVLKKKDGPKTKRVAGEDLTASDFIIVGDKDDPSTWKLPWHFSSEEKTKSHLRNALARFNQMKGVSEDEKDAARRKLNRLCREHGIDVTGQKAKQVEFVKSLYDVGDLANMLASVRYMISRCEYEAEWEGDDRDAALATELRQVLEDMVSILKDMVEEETDELVADKASKLAALTAKSKGESMTDLEKRKDAASHIHKAAAEHEALAAHHEEMAGEHDGAMEHCKAMMDHCKGMEDLEEPMKAMHKAMHDYSKSMHGMHKAKSAHHMKAAKAHKAMSSHFSKLGAALESGMEADKVAEKAAEVTAVVTPVAAAIPEELTKSITSMTELAKALTETLNSTKEEVGKLSAKVDEIGNRPVPIPGLRIVPRSGEDISKAATGTEGKKPIAFSPVTSDEDSGV